MFSFVGAGFAYLDLPFGNKAEDKMAPWNVAPTEEELKSVLRSISAATTRSAWIVCFKLHPRQYAVVENAMTSFGLKSVQAVYWYKVNANVTGTKKFTPAVETMLIGFSAKEGGNAFNWKMDDNPTKRHNVIFAKGVTKYVAKGPDPKNRVNNAQSPMCLAATVASCFELSQGSTCFVGCAGTGSDGIGLAAEGFDVVMMESDEEQVKAIKSRLTTIGSELSRTGISLKELIHNTEGEGQFSLGLYTEHLRKQVEEAEKQSIDMAAKLMEETTCPVCTDNLAVEDQEEEEHELVKCHICKRDIHKKECSKAHPNENLFGMWVCADDCKGSQAQEEEVEAKKEAISPKKGDKKSSGKEEKAGSSSSSSSSSH